jgi:hypothetical protein
VFQPHHHRSGRRVTIAAIFLVSGAAKLLPALVIATAGKGNGFVHPSPPIVPNLARFWGAILPCAGETFTKIGASTDCELRAR